jgi:probable F420-dependent oxidoreductase
MQRPFRFGTGAYHATSRDDYLAGVREIEALGYAVLHTPDHFVGGQLAPIAALMAAADATSTLRITTAVFANDFRHPVIVANEAATLDLLSGGRFEFGIGTGYLAPDYTGTGIPFDPPGVRINRLTEAIQIIKGLWSNAPVTFRGAYYTVDGLEGFPKPQQQPYPPIMIAGGGKRMLSLAAREADIVGLTVPTHGGSADLAASTTASTAQQVEWIRQVAGDRFEELELSTMVFGVVVTDHRQREAEELARTLGITGDQVLDSTQFLVGTVDQMAEEIQMWRERFGISYITVVQKYRDALAPVVARLAGT